ncbi:MAG: flagellar biosynthetic protein FliR [Clostridiales Family XIII bacterium]|jgi:flagellar biosynthetic protein FliR|nr:flagellar biosynthetic protein FliR [Clostridiales Family XIII bacterium]
MINISYLLSLAFVSCRMFGVIFFNPLFGRQIIPAIVRVGISLCLGYFAASGMPQMNAADYSGVLMLAIMLKEFTTGFVLGFVMTLFFSIFHIGGQIIDYQLGLAMATMFDPTSNSQISITGNLLTVFYTLLFFVTNSHLNLLAIALTSYEVAPMGFGSVNPQISIYIVELFAYILIYAVQLALPWIVTIMAVEAAVGIMMKVVPNINVFVVNIQMKVICGLIILVTIIPALSSFMTKINMIMMSRLDTVLTNMI